MQQSCAYIHIRKKTPDTSPLAVLVPRLRWPVCWLSWIQHWELVRKSAVAESKLTMPLLRTGAADDGDAQSLMESDQSQTATGRNPVSGANVGRAAADTEHAHSQ